MKIVFATGNEGKMVEIREILEDLPGEILSLKQLGIKAEAEETGKTFAENAEIRINSLKAGDYADGETKATAVTWDTELTGKVTVADDTHVEFCGELFTLSGFCRAFMPDGKRKPSNAYQGPKYFTYGGVTLVRLRAEKTVCVEVETQEVQTEENTVATPSYLAQERTEAHDLTTYHGEKNNGLKRMFVQQTNTSVLRIFNGFSTENLRKNTKCRKISSQKVVHTLPMPPPILPYLPCTSHTTVNKTITSKKSIIMEHSLKKELLQYFAAKDSRTEQEERLYKRMQAEVNHYDITSVEKSDLEERGYDTSELDEADMERIADEMCGYYLDSSTFSEDLYAAADELGIKKNDEEE